MSLKRTLKNKIGQMTYSNPTLNKRLVTFRQSITELEKSLNAKSNGDHKKHS